MMALLKEHAKSRTGLKILSILQLQKRKHQCWKLACRESSDHGRLACLATTIITALGTCFSFTFYFEKKFSEHKLLRR